MLWFKFHNSATASEVFINLACFTIARTYDGSIDLWPNQYHSHDECYTVTGKDAERLKRLMEREANLAEPKDMGEPS